MTDAPFLPLLYEVSRYVFNPGAKNDLGNKVEGGEDPVGVSVYGWGAPQSQVPKEVVVGTSRYVVELELMVPPGVYMKDGDRVRLAPLLEVLGMDELGQPHAWWRVVGLTEDYSHNPFGWNPGNVINLVTVKGAKA